MVVVVVVVVAAAVLEVAFEAVAGVVADVA